MWSSHYKSKNQKIIHWALCVGVEIFIQCKVKTQTSNSSLKANSMPKHQSANQVIKTVNILSLISLLMRWNINKENATWYLSCFEWAYLVSWCSELLDDTRLHCTAAKGNMGQFRSPTIETDLTSVEWERGEWPRQSGWWCPDTEVLPVAAATARAHKQKINRLPTRTH